MNVINRLTLSSLKINRTRTIVTIIGVILSAAMITGVTTFISSLQSFLIKTIIADSGNWHASVENATLKDLNLVKNSKDIGSYTTMRSKGFAKLEGSKNQYKPYLYFVEFDSSTFKAFPIKMIEGRLPENPNEIVIPNHIYTNAGIKFNVGDTITVDIGTRKTRDGYVLSQKHAYVETDDTNPMEILTDLRTETYTIVGICDRPSFEYYSAPGYTVITYAEQESYADGSFDIYFNVKKPAKIYDVLGDMDFEGALTYHSDLLRFMGISDNDNFNSILYSLCGILMVLIMVGSVSLIYNSFSISVSERKKQYGLLSGAGATAKQLRSSVFFEAFFISIFGIPIGVLCGVAGIGVTLYLLSDVFASFRLSDNVNFTLSVSPASIFAAVIIGIVTVLISAYIPARKCSKMSAMDAIRQTTDIKMSSKNVRTLPVFRKLFGMEGDLALKNIKRNKKRYRATVISLFISIVLFISASSFSLYTMESVSKVYQDVNFDLSYMIGANEVTEEYRNLFDRIKALNTIQEASIISILYADTTISKDMLMKAYYDNRVSEQIITDGDPVSVGIMLYAVDDDTFRAYLDELGESHEKYFDLGSLSCIVVDKQQYYDYSRQRMVDEKILNKDKIAEISINNYEGNVIQTAKIGKFTEKTPLGIQEYSYNSLTLIIPETVKAAMFSAEDNTWNAPTFMFKSDKPNDAANDITDLLLEGNFGTTGLTNKAEMMQMTRNTVLIVKVFSYGFIILISLITIANVFNTISTNVNLRRREFAMLRSVGLTSKGFRKMLNYECVFYGLKALLYGMPVSILLTYLIYSSIMQGVDMGFHLPVQSIVLSIIVVFGIVFTTMMYSMSKIRKENILDALRVEM